MAVDARCWGIVEAGEGADVGVTCLALRTDVRAGERETEAVVAKNTARETILSVVAGEAIGPPLPRVRGHEIPLILAVAGLAARTLETPAPFLVAINAGKALSFGRLPVSGQGEPESFVRNAAAIQTSELTVRTTVLRVTRHAGVRVGDPTVERRRVTPLRLDVGVARETASVHRRSAPRGRMAAFTSLRQRSV